MFARLTTIYIRPDKIDKTIEIFNESILPAARKQKGYCGALLLTDRENGKGVAITYWESKEDAVSNEENKYYQKQLLKTVVLFSADPRREGFEVSVMDRI